MSRCEPRSEIYTNCINALNTIEEIGWLTLDDARAVGNIDESAVGHGRQVGGRQRHGGRRSSIIHLVGVPHLVGVTHLVDVTHPYITTPWRKQVKQ